MYKLTAILLLFFGCQIENKADALYSISYLSHGVRIRGGTKNITLRIKNLSAVPLPTIKIVVELTLSNNKDVLVSFPFENMNMGVNASQNLAFSISGYADVEENRVFNLNQIKTTKLVVIIIYNESNEELSKALFPSIVL